MSGQVLKHYLIILLFIFSTISGCISNDENQSNSSFKSSIESPEPHQIIQRKSDGTAGIPIMGVVESYCNLIEARLVSMTKDGIESGNNSEWSTIVAAEKSEGSEYFGTINAVAGWYRVEIRFSQNGTIIDTKSVYPVGIGEVFIISGQSNSANSGDTKLIPSDSRVSAWGFEGWQFGEDPQPIATGEGGSPWPYFGDLLVQEYGVPIGLISVGWGGTAVHQWLPGPSSDSLFHRIEAALDEVGPYGARAILWHQGESDLQIETSSEVYSERLGVVINTSRDHAGWDIPWVVARASYLPTFSNESMARIVDAQQIVIDNDPLTFEGPYTDDLIGEEWRYDGIHFNELGLIEHAMRWNTSVIGLIE